uniref:Uncharacterized protein n=1 Tax=Brassica oleracea TaxID=3712 RepID=A0A3P6FYE9_BRAOL|nr:unnamed protein product [Brassica oleracea]
MTPLSSLLMGKHHTGLQLAPETELALLSDQAVHLVEGLELDKLNEKFLPIKDTHQVGYVQEATTHNVFFCFLRYDTLFNPSSLVTQVVLVFFLRYIFRFTSLLPHTI